MINCRPAFIDDLTTLVAGNCAIAIETEQIELSQTKVSEGVRAILSDETRGFYCIAEKKAEVVGQILITYEWSDWRNALFWWIQSVYVVPSHRQKGIYKKMYERVRSMSRQSEIPVCGFRLYAESNNNTAHKAYINCGMEKCNYVMFEES